MYPEPPLGTEAAGIKLCFQRQLHVLLNRGSVQKLLELGSFSNNG
jgi:hypothetical protein